MDYYLTPEKLAELKTDLHMLKTERRAEIAERLRHAKDLGDLSENSEYMEAREEQERTEMRIVELEEMIKNARLFTRSTGKEVNIGSVVEVSKNNERLLFTIVGSHDVDPAAGKISLESPLGRACMGKRVGDTAKVQTPGGEVTYKITKVE